MFSIKSLETSSTACYDVIFDKTSSNSVYFHWVIKYWAFHCFRGSWNFSLIGIVWKARNFKEASFWNKFSYSPSLNNQSCIRRPLCQNLPENWVSKQSFFCFDIDNGPKKFFFLEIKLFCFWSELAEKKNCNVIIP